MDAERFDHWTRALPVIRTRRGALALLVGGPLGVLGLTETAAKKKGKKKQGGSPPAVSPPPSPPCVPKTCAAFGRTCGPAQDGCGGTLNCGGCTDDGFACSTNSCEPRLGICLTLHDNAYCQAQAGDCHGDGRCDPSHPDAVGNGCVYSELANGTACDYDGNGTMGTCCGGICLTIVGQPCTGSGGVSGCTEVCDANDQVVCQC